MATHTYRNLGGQHILLDGTTIEKGEVFECDDPELLTKFPQKFERVHPGEAEGAPTAGDRTDVTTDFPEAAEADLTVLKDRKGWFVFDEGDEPLNEKPLKKKDVAAFIETYLED